MPREQKDKLQVRCCILLVQSIGSSASFILCRYPYSHFALAGCTQSLLGSRAIADQDEPVCYPSQGEMRRLEGQVQQEKQQSLKAAAV